MWWAWGARIGAWTSGAGGYTRGVGIRGGRQGADAAEMMGPHIVRIGVVLLLRDAEDEVCDNKQLQPCGRGATSGGVERWWSGPGERGRRERERGAVRRACGTIVAADPWPTAKGGAIVVPRCRRAAHRYNYLHLLVLVEVEHLLLIRQSWFCLDLHCLLLPWWQWQRPRRPFLTEVSRGFRRLVPTPLRYNRCSCRQMHQTVVWSVPRVECTSRHRSALLQQPSNFVFRGAFGVSTHTAQHSLATVYSTLSSLLSRVHI